MQDREELTIAGVAREAQVGVETVRYYERRGLIAQPPRPAGSVRRYGAEVVSRIRFVKRAQELGFTLEEIASLLSLQDGESRSAIRRIAASRLAEIRSRVGDLKRLEKTLQHLLEQCEHGATRSCPIIEAIAGTQRPAAQDKGAISPLSGTTILR